MGAPTLCHSFLVVGAPLQGAHTCLTVPGVFATLKPPVTERRRLQRLFYHPDGASMVCESL